MDKKKILICDDDEGILEMLQMFLDDSGYEVIAEINSLNVMSIIEKQKPDLLLLDLWMPVVSGDQILKVIRTDEKNSKLPVIVISASQDGKVIAIAAGANGFIAKPFDIDYLLNKVDSLLLN